MNITYKSTLSWQRGLVRFTTQISATNALNAIALFTRTGVNTAFVKKAIYLLCICFLFACKNNKSPFYDDILKSENGQLRGATIGHTIEEIKPLEDDNFLKESMSDYLHYDYEISMGNSYTVTYDFSDDNELYEIELAVFLDVITDADLLFKNLSYHFNRKYSIGKTEEDGYITWHTKSKKSANRVAISMINDSESYGYVTILIRNLDY
tara:strand:+ start:1041 stop:1667 length:627 start_codon:yes stop_codon:yes gene_type:complete